MNTNTPAPQKIVKERDLLRFTTTIETEGQDVSAAVDAVRGVVE